MLTTIDVGEGDAARRIAVRRREGRGPPVVWFGGFRSDMRATKAEALDAWAAAEGRAFVRFDYSGHGESGGAFTHGTISRWLEEALAVVDAFAPASPVLVGSSMGAWIATLSALRRASAAPARRPCALVLIAPAIDFTERLMWDEFPTEIRRAIEDEGVYLRSSLYSNEPYPITRALIEDGRNHLLLEGPIATGCPVRILQGMRDPDVPWEHAMRIVDRLPGDDVQLTLVKNGDHRLSRPQDIELLIRAVDEMIDRAPG